MIRVALASLPVVFAGARGHLQAALDALPEEN